MSHRLPNPPDDYDRAWANQQTRQIEQEFESMHASLNNAIANPVLPSYTTAQKLTLENRVGRLIFDTDLGKACINTGVGWETITSTP